MKKNYLTLVFTLIFCTGVVSAQNEFPTAKNSSVKIDGGGINYVQPVASGGWARGINFFNTDLSERYLALGVFGGGAEAKRFYLTFGDSPWNSQLGLHLLPNGNIGIGTTTPREKLSVNGRVRAQEVKVEASPWPDYVFDEDYPLPSLEETEQYIRKHGHLKGIPKAEEVAREGLSLGEMNAKLLEKVEELTLYLLNQNERIKRLEKDNATLKKCIINKSRTYETDSL